MIEMKYENIDKEIKETLKNWKSIVEKYQRPDNKKAAIQIINSFLPYIALWVLTYYSLRWSYFITAPLLLINAFFLVRIFIIQHDCGHQSFFTNKKLNNLMGTICSLFSFIPYRYWKKVHSYHHGHSGQLEVRDIGDIPMLTVQEFRERSWWGKFKYHIWRIPVVTFIIAPIYYFIISNRYPIFRFNNWKKYTYMQIKDNFWIALAYSICGFLIGWKHFLFIQITMVILFGIIAFWFFYVQHQHEFSYKQWKHNWDFLLSTMRGSTYYKLPRFMHWLTGNIGYHHIHHLSSLIPNYNLPKIFKEKPILNKYVTKVGFFESFKMMSNKLWDEEMQKMISFRDYYRMERLRIA